MAQILLNCYFRQNRLFLKGLFEHFLIFAKTFGKFSPNFPIFVVACVSGHISVSYLLENIGGLSLISVIIIVTLAEVVLLVSSFVAMRVS